MDQPSSRPMYDKKRILKYFDLIGVPHSSYETPDLTTLRTLQAHQLAKVPFENLSLHYSRNHQIILDAEYLYDKVVNRGRGGYCMENNNFFATVLRSMGYTICTVGARVNVAGASGLDDIVYGGWSHMVSLVTLEGQKYLVDVGFGLNGTTAPLLLEDGHEEQSTAHASMRVLYQNIPSSTDPQQRLWIYEHRKSPEAKYKPVICFTELEFLPEDYDVINHYTSTSKRVFFTYEVVVTKMIMEHPQALIGTLTLWGGEIKKHIGGKTEVVMNCKSEEERISALKKFFDIELTEEERRGITGLVSQLKG